MKEKKIFVLKLIDGFKPEKAIMVIPPKVNPGCPDDKHCASHGSGPFFCCKCGAEFQPVAE